MYFNNDGEVTVTSIVPEFLVSVKMENSDENATDLKHYNASDTTSLEESVSIFAALWA